MSSYANNSFYTIFSSLISHSSLIKDYINSLIIPFGLLLKVP